MGGASTRRCALVCYYPKFTLELTSIGDIDGVEQLTRYLELMNRDPALRPVRGIFAAQEIKPQARVLATDRGIECVVVNYDELRGIDDPSLRLF
jgi:RecB family endonuclease NucS